MTTPNTPAFVAEADYLAAIEAARANVRIRHNLTARQLQELEGVRHTNAACTNWSGSAHTVLETLARKGLINFKRDAKPQWRGYHVTAAGLEALKPITEATAALRAFRDSVRDAEQKASQQAYARRALMLDGEQYQSSTDIDNEVRRQLGLDKLIGLK